MRQSGEDMNQSTRWWRVGRGTPATRPQIFHLVVSRLACKQPLLGRLIHISPFRRNLSVKRHWWKKFLQKTQPQWGELCFC